MTTATKANGRRRRKKAPAADATPETPETPDAATAADATPETPETPDATPETPETPETPDAATAAPDPAEAQRARIAEMETEIAEIRSEMAAMIATGSIDDIAAAARDAEQIQAEIDRTQRMIAELCFAADVEAMVLDNWHFAPSDIPPGYIQIAIVVEDHELVGVRPVVKVSPGKRGATAPKRPARRASGARDPRLGPAGVTITAPGGTAGGKPFGPVQLTFTETSEVIAKGGPTVFGDHIDSRYATVSAVAKAVTGRVPNGYTWARLGPSGHEWNGHHPVRG